MRVGIVVITDDGREVHHTIEFSPDPHFGGWVEEPTALEYELRHQFKIAADAIARALRRQMVSA